MGVATLRALVGAGMPNFLRSSVPKIIVLHKCQLKINFAEKFGRRIVIAGTHPKNKKTNAKVLIFSMDWVFCFFSCSYLVFLVF
jgi:hypothetical protein